MHSYQGSVAEIWKPTFENVTRDFITDTLDKILFSPSIPNFRFDFREQEAMNFIEKVLTDYTTEYDSFKEKSQRIMDKLKEKTDGNETEAVMIVNDYLEFFEQLRRYYDRTIELYFLRTGSLSFKRWEKENCFEQVWLRATPEDFNHPEEFLRKQADMINDRTLEKYDKETRLGKIKLLGDNILCVKNGIARTWDENSREMEITIYDKDHYHNTGLFNRPSYSLPKVRYGIYEKDGRKVCRVGSIQNVSEGYIYEDLQKDLDRKRYKANENVPTEDTNQVEPKNLLALSIFINILHSEGITDIEVPGFYVLDHEYHRKRNEIILADFNKEWPEEMQKKCPHLYKRAYDNFKRNYKQEDLISEIKSERLLLTFRRVLQHYPNANITSYPGDADSNMHLEVPVVKNKDDINGEIFKELYELVKQLNSEIEL